MSRPRISIWFCGGCNPRIDRGEVARQVKEALEQSGCEVAFNVANTDLIIYLSGCSSNCAYKYFDDPIPGVVVAAATVDAWPVSESDLPSEIVKRVREACERLERHLL